VSKVLKRSWRGMGSKGSPREAKGPVQVVKQKGTKHKRKGKGKRWVVRRLNWEVVNNGWNFRHSKRNGG